MEMDRAEFENLLREAFDYLEEYYPRLQHAHLRETLAEIIWSQGVEDVGDTQQNYEYLRSRIESILDGYKEHPGPFDWEPQV